MLSMPATVDLATLFEAPFSIAWARETLLGGNVWADETTRLLWNKENSYEYDNRFDDSFDQGMIVDIHPMEIRTFIVKMN